MKLLIQRLFYNCFAIFAVGLSTGAFVYGSNPQNLAAIALVFTAIELLIQPIVTILFTPINIITLGLLRWIPALITLYLTILSLESVSLTSFTLTSFKIAGFSTPTIHFGVFSSYLAITLIIIILKKILRWLLKN